jgi:hypothetical protein
MTPKPRAIGLALATLAALAASGCGSPATVTPASTPLPGLAHDVGAARNVVAQSQAQAQAQTGATLP